MRLFAAILATYLTAFAAAAPGPVTVAVAGRVAESSPPPLELSGHLMLPVDFLEHRLGLSVRQGTEAGTWIISAYGRYVKVRKNCAQFVVDQTHESATQPVAVIGDRLYVPAEILTRGFNIVWGRSAITGVHQLEPQGARIQEVRSGSHDDHVRLVFDMSAPAPYWSSTAEGEFVVEVAPPQPLPAQWGALSLFTFSDPLNPRVTVKKGEADWSRVTVTYDGSRPATLTTVGGPPRLIADIPRDAPLTPAAPPPQPECPPTLPAVASTPWSLRHFGTARGPVRVFVLKASPTAIIPALAGATIRNRAAVSAIAIKHRAPAAINGGYFDVTGSPLGMLVINGEWIKHPTRNRCALGITQTGEAIIGRQRFEGAVRIDGVGKLDLGGINASHWQLDKAMLYTRRWNSEVGGSEHKVRAIVSPDEVITRVETGGRTVGIPVGGYVVSAGGDTGQVLATAKVGAKVTANIGAVPHWPDLRHGIGAGPQLVKNGVKSVTVDEELFRADVRRVCSRSAVGVAEDGNVIIVAAEASVAGGLGLWELASVMAKLGCKDAMALDGGGSTTVYSKGAIINHPADGQQRPVSNALLIYGVTGSI